MDYDAALLLQSFGQGVMTSADHYRKNGYAVFRGTLPVRQLDAREREIIAPYKGPLPRHDGTFRTREEVSAGRLALSGLHGLMNPHLWRLPPFDGYVAAFRDVVFSSAIFDALHSLDGEAHYTLHQTVFFFESPLTGPHIEAVSLDTTPRGRSFTVWAAIDPVTPLNGPPYVVSRPLGHYEADPPERTIPAHYRITGEGLQARGETLTALILNPGDFVVWGPGTPHGSMGPLPESRARRSFQAIYRPTRIDRWGGYPNHSEPHSIVDEEIVVDERFNVLKAAVPHA